MYAYIALPPVRIILRFSTSRDYVLVATPEYILGRQQTWHAPAHTQYSSSSSSSRLSKNLKILNSRVSIVLLGSASAESDPVTTATSLAVCATLNIQSTRHRLGFDRFGGHSD